MTYKNKKEKSKKKIKIALSSGIDSTIALIILKKNKIYLESTYMENWEKKKNTKCMNFKDKKYIIYLCNKNKKYVDFTNFSTIYWTNVFTPFIKNLKKGNTPNPDIKCNQKIKFNELIKYSKFKNFNFLATGHYAKIEKEKNYKLKMSFDKKKDQTYFLYNIKKNTIKNIIFPLANYSKCLIKKFIKKKLLINYNKKESMGICFIEEKNFKSFLEKFIKKNKGYFFFKDKIIEKHDGLHLYTVGEKVKIKKKKYYIQKKIIKKNKIYVANNLDDIKSNKILIKKNIKIKKNFLYDLKTKHTSNTNKCFIKIEKNKIKIVLKKKEILTNGQHIVFYKNKNCLNGFEI